MQTEAAVTRRLFQKVPKELNTSTASKELNASTPSIISSCHIFISAISIYSTTSSSGYSRSSGCSIIFSSSSGCSIIFSSSSGYSSSSGCSIIFSSSSGYSRSSGCSIIFSSSSGCSIIFSSSSGYSSSSGCSIIFSSTFPTYSSREASPITPGYSQACTGGSSTTSVSTKDSLITFHGPGLGPPRYIHSI
uniref:Uncharacterized protein n=1 Tax=Knipowitschia caucasica TaxID=637954 RepID=A0AAV2K123_KNICA